MSSGDRHAPPDSMTELERLIEASRRLAQDPRVVQGGGGNVSLKSGDEMWVKASGQSLKSLTPERGFARVAWSDLADKAAKLQSGSEASSRDPGVLANAESSFLGLSPTPSIEVWLHALVGRVGVHLHPNGLLPFVCHQEWKQRTTQAFGPLPEGVPTVWVPYAKPGLELALMFLRALTSAGLSSHEPRLVAFLQNHGLMTVGETVDEAVELAWQIIRAGGALPTISVPPPPIPNHRGALRDFLEGVSSAKGSFVEWETPSSAELVRAVNQGRLRDTDVLFPDQVVYCGPQILVLDGDSKLLWGTQWNSYKLRWCVEPSVVLHSAGPVMLKKKPGSADTVREETLDALLEAVAPGREVLRMLQQEEIEALVHWDRELFRQTVL